MKRAVDGGDKAKDHYPMNSFPTVQGVHLKVRAWTEVYINICAFSKPEPERARESQTGLSKPPNEIPRWEEMVRLTMMMKMLRMMVTMMRLRIVGMQGVRESNDGWRTNQHELHHQRNVHKNVVTLLLYLYHPHPKITKNY